MSTFLQEKLADKIIENAKTGEFKTKQDLVESVGYGRKTALVRSGAILESEGVKLALAAKGFTEANAKGVVAKILTDEKEKSDTRLKAADMAFKVHGSYAAEKVLIGVVNNAEIVDEEVLMKLANGEAVE